MGIRVGINALFLKPGRVGGTERYTRGLVRGLARHTQIERVTVFVSPEAADSFDEPGIEVVSSPVPARHRVLRILYEHVWMRRLVRRHRLDVLHSTGYVAPKQRYCPSVVTIHDIQIMADPRFAPWTHRKFWGVMLPRVVKTVDRIMTDSYASGGDLERYLGAKPDRIDVIYPGIDPEFFDPAAATDPDEVRARFALQRPFVLVVATLSPHKNVAGAVHAFARLARVSATDRDLVIVGMRWRKVGEVFAAVSGLGLERRVKILSDVSERDLRALYRMSDAFLLPSFFEGFGFPVLEAMASGTPVAASNVAAIPEIVGGAALLFDPRDPQAIADALAEILSNGMLRDELRQRGQARAMKFTWERAVDEVVDSYRRAIAGSERTSHA